MPRISRVNVRVDLIKNMAHSICTVFSALSGRLQRGFSKKRTKAKKGEGGAKVGHLMRTSFVYDLFSVTITLEHHPPSCSPAEIVTTVNQKTINFINVYI